MQRCLENVVFDSLLPVGWTIINHPKYALSSERRHCLQTRGDKRRKPHSFLHVDAWGTSRHAPRATDHRVADYRKLWRSRQGRQT